METWERPSTDPFSINFGGSTFYVKHVFGDSQEELIFFHI